MTATKLQVYFEDEAPRIGAGWRLVYAKIGRKWVRLVEHGSGHRTKLSRKTFNTLKIRRPDHVQSH